MPWAEEVCRQVDTGIALEWAARDGDTLAANQRIVTLEGAARSLLTAERTILNFLQTLSGTATATRALVRLVAATSCRLLDTRKTIPGLRVAQKYAVRCGGGHNHRMGLYDAFLIKENHIATAGSIANAVARARERAPGKPIEVEVETLAQLEEAIACNVDIAMLDNFSVDATRSAVLTVRSLGSRLKLEASGGLDETSITEIAATGVDYISVGNLTKRVRPLDLSMRLELKAP
jgi:nicotinate-nucleotide pyrophosphorylase (carboxylating)